MEHVIEVEQCPLDYFNRDLTVHFSDRDTTETETQKVTDGKKNSIVLKKQQQK